MVCCTSAPSSDKSSSAAVCFSGLPEVKGDGPWMPSSSAQEAQGDVWEVSGTVSPWLEQDDHTPTVKVTPPVLTFNPCCSIVSVIFRCNCRNPIFQNNFWHLMTFCLQLVICIVWVYYCLCYCVCREKKELQKILDRKRQNSISEAKSRDKDKAET